MVHTLYNSVAKFLDHLGNFCERAHPRTRHQWLLRCAKLRPFISFHTAFRMASSTMFNWSRLHRSLLFGGCTLQLQALFNETVWNPTEEPWTYLEPSRINRSQFLTCVQGNFVQVCGIQPVIHTSSLSPQCFIMFCLRTRCERRWRTKCASGAETRRRMARERRGAGSSLVSMETPYYKTIY